MPPRKNTSKQNLLEKAGRTFSIAQLELKRQRILTLVAWGTLVIVLVLFVAVYTSLSKNASRSTASDLSLGNDSKDIYLAKRSGISDAGRREDLVVPDDHRARIAHDPLMVAATGQAGAVWLGTQFGEVIGRENGDERLVKRGDDRAVEIGASANDPHVIQVVEPAQQVFAGSGADYTPDQSVFVVNGSAPIEDEEDPNGTPRIADIETAQGSIMRAPIVWSARFDDDDDESDAADVNAAGVTTTRTRKTRSRTSRIPWLQPTSTSTTTPLDFPPRPLSYDMRCGNGFGTACQSGLCCSEWSWCGVTGDHCGARCQAGFGRCNGGTAAPPVAPAPPPAPPAVPAPPPSPPQSRPYNKGAGVVAYFPNWSQKNLASFDLKGIDVINYAFVTMRSDGSLSGSGDYNQGGMQHTLNKVMKDRYPKLRTVFSIGGWTESQWFSVVAADAGRRARFATSIRDYMVANRFDGVDLDWEYPTGGGQPGNTESPQDSANFVLMVQEIRRAIGSQALITIAASADTSKYGNYLVPLANELDWINLMTYDFAGPWQGSAGLNSPLDAQSAAMQAFANAGVPKAKLSMGLAFYGRGFSVASGDNNGLGQRIVGTPGGDGAVEPGVWSWSSLRAGILSTGPMTPISGWVRSYLSSQQNPILFNPNRRIFIGYDDPVSICAKARWAKNQGFGGVMVWDLSMDKDRELSSAMTDAWNGIRTVC